MREGRDLIAVCQYFYGAGGAIGWVPSGLVSLYPERRCGAVVGQDDRTPQVTPYGSFSMPTLEDVLPELSRAKVFPLSDTKDGFLQTMLDQHLVNKNS